MNQTLSIHNVAAIQVKGIRKLTAEGALPVYTKVFLITDTKGNTVEIVAFADASNCLDPVLA